MERLDKLIACLAEMGFKPKISKFEDRLRMQKIACLMELMGTDIGYHFYSTHIRGPYSTALTQDIFSSIEKVETLKTACNLEEKTRNAAKKIAEISRLDPYSLEIMATYLFFVIKEGKNEKDAVLALKKLKPFIADDQMAVGLSRAKQLIPLYSENELADARKEFAEIETIDMRD